MTEEKFEAYVLRLFDRVWSILKRKQQEYVLDKSDRFKAFKHEWLNSEIKDKPKQTLWFQMAKHIDSIHDMCMSDKEFKFEVWDEKIVDIINYLCILNCMIVEEKNGNRSL